MRSARITGAESLGRILRESRLRSGLTQEELARELDVSPRYVRELEAGKPTKALQRLFEFMRETDVSLYAELSND